MSYELVKTPSGVYSLRSKENLEIFHPGIGPMEEALILHVKQQEILIRANEKSKFILWDVGLGAGANAVAALNQLRKCQNEVEIHSFDLTESALRFALENSEYLVYPAPFTREIQALLRDRVATVHKKIRWFFHQGDFRETMHQPELPQPHGVFYDPYSPRSNLEMWSLEHFQKLYPLLAPDCLLTNYTRSTAVRTTLLLSGFFIGKGVGIGTKGETTIVTKDLALLKNPLTKIWLDRVRISRNSSPLGSEDLGDKPIEYDDFEKLVWHPQFSRRPNTNASIFQRNSEP